MIYHGLTRNSMEHLGQAAVHARSLAGSQDYGNKFFHRLTFQNIASWQKQVLR
jgi:hypothetical protein